MGADGRTGFTLIEVLIVVVIMSVLAAVIIPQFSSATQDAKASALLANLRSLRVQTQMYRAQHADQYPTIQGNSLPQLTSATNIQGIIGAPGPAYPLGPYVEGQLPANPFDDSNKVTAVTRAGQKPTRAVGTLGGWLYDVSNGAVWPNHAAYYLEEVDVEVSVRPIPMQP